MYRILDVLGVALQGAKEHIRRDRDKLSPTLARLAEFASDHGLVVGGAAAKTMLTRRPGDELPTDLCPLHLYGPEAAARALADAARKMGELVVLQIKIPHKLFQLTVDGVDYATFEVVEKVDHLMPSTRPSLWHVDKKEGAAPPELLCLGPEMLLLETYAALCNPAECGKWLDLLADEEKLRSVILAELSAKVKKAVGGAADKRALTKFTGALKTALTHDHAAVDLKGGAPAYITQLPFPAEQTMLLGLAKRSGVELHMTVQDPGIPLEPRLRRLAVRDEEGRPLLHVYNAGAFEVVPVVDTRGSYFVQLRFLLVDLWTVLLVRRKGALTAGAATARLHTILDAYRHVAAKLKNAAPDLLFPTTSIGTAVSASLALKRSMFGKPSRR